MTKESTQYFRATTALLTAGSVPMAYCLTTHFCMCGHRAHPSENPGFDQLIDYSALTLISLGLILSLQLPTKKALPYLYFILFEALAISGFSLLALIPYYIAVFLLQQKPSSSPTHPDESALAS